MEFGLVVVWWLLYVGLGLLAVPAASLLFTSFTDDGAGMAIPVAFTVVAFVGFWVGHLTFGLETALVAVGALALLSGFALWKGVGLNFSRYGEAVVVFTLAYLLLLSIRVFKPGVWPGGGEKFLDYGLLASILRSTQLPPEDIWFANESMQYYYGGHMLAAIYALLTDTAPKYAYNLALPGYYAAFVTAAWGLGGAIAAGRGLSYRVGGGIAAFFVAIASNLSTPLRLLIWALPEPVGTRLAAIASLEVKGLATGPTNFDYWFASRVIDFGFHEGNQVHLIDEFPFFGFLNGDLHGHMMSPTFLLLGAALAYAYYRTPRENLTRRRLLVFGAVPPVSAVVLIVNTWSFPAIIGVVWLTLLFAPAPAWDLLPRAVSAPVDRFLSGDWRRVEAGRIGVATAFAVVVAVLGLVAALPYVLGPASGRELGFLPEPRSDLPGLLVVDGAFLAISAGYLASKVAKKDWGRLAVGVGVFLALTWLLQAPAVGLFLPPLVGGWYLLRTRDGVGFETVLLVGVLGLLLLVEFVFVVEQAAPGRLNTFFKVYSQVWALWSISAGAMAAWFFARGTAISSLPRAVGDSWNRFRDRLASTGSNGGPAKATAGSSRSGMGTDGGQAGEESRGGGIPVTRILLVVMIVALSIYAAFSLAWVFETGRDDPTLDSHAYIDDRHPEEAEAIRWLAARDGQPTLVSAPGIEVYQWANGPASMTGIPTVAGWIQEVGYRGEDAYWDRVHDVEILFETAEPESRAILLKKYEVDYIYVGPLERERYETYQYDSEPGISVAFENEGVTIYEVDRDELVE